MGDKCTIDNLAKTIMEPIQLLAQVIIFSVSKYTLISMIKCNFSIRGLVGALIPANYFVILYIVVFIISPYINLIFVHLDSRKRKLSICTLILLFSVYPTMVDVLIEVTKHSFNGLSSIGMYGSQYGYSIVNFALCYCVGAYIRFESEDISKVNTSKLIGGLLATLMGYAISDVICVIVLCRMKLMVVEKKFIFATLGMAVFFVMWRILIPSNAIFGLVLALVFCLYCMFLYRVDINRLVKMVRK